MAWHSSSVHVAPLSTGGALTQAPLEQTRPSPAQSAHAAPAPPHAAAVVPGTHCPCSLQQPWHVVEQGADSGAASFEGGSASAAASTWLSSPPVYPFQSSTIEQPPDDATIATTPT